MLPQLQFFTNRSWLPGFGLVLFLSLFGQAATAQLLIDPGFSVTDTNQVHVLHTLQGDFLSGRVMSIRDSVITFDFQQNNLNFTFDEILRIEVYYPGQTFSSSGDFPTTSGFVPMQGHENLLFSPTGFTLPKGRTEYRNIGILANSLETGLTDNLSLGGGFLLPVVIFAKAKLAFPLDEKVHLGVGTNFFVPTIGLGANSLGHFYATASFGTPDNFFNITAGQYFVFDEFGDSEFAATIGGVRRIGDRWRFMADVFVVPAEFENGAFIPTLGLSWFVPQHRIDFGLATFGDFSSGVFPIPYVAYAFRFGKSR